MSDQRNGKYSCIEFERRFLVRAVPANIAASSYDWRIVDRYIEGTRLRLRRMESHIGDQIQRKLTQKFSESAEPTIQTTITNIYLNEVEYRVLEALGGNEILKYRYVIDFQNHQFGIDVFGGRHSGLILSEVEGESELALKQLPLPKFAVRDVTGDRFFTGGALATVSEHDFKKRLAEEAG
jgi:CYTH domain-containing protein